MARKKILHIQCISTKTTGLVGEVAQALDTAPFGCGCDRGTRVDAEGTTRRDAEIRLVSGFLGEAMG